MPSPTIKFKRLHENAILPTRGTDGAACYDLYSVTETHLTYYRPVIVIPTGIAMQLPSGYVGLVCSRSGLAAKHRTFVVNSPGIIDEDYQGELKIILGHVPNDYGYPNLNPITFPAGSRLAQLMIMPLPQLQVEEVTEFTTTTNRGTGGLGSTGI